MKLPKPGDQFHAVTTGITVATSTSLLGASTVLTRGQTVTLTADMIEASRDRNGDSWLDLLHDDLAQIARWGEVRIAPGPAPADMAPWLPGSPEEDAAREQARRAAYALVDDAERRLALARVDERFGRLKTSRTLNSAAQRPLVSPGQGRGR